MGVVKGAAKHTARKTVNKAVDDMGVVGDVVDAHTSTGPLDKAEDAANKAAKDVKKKTKEIEKDVKKATKEVKKELSD